MSTSLFENADRVSTHNSRFRTARRMVIQKEKRITYNFYRIKQYLQQHKEQTRAKKQQDTSLQHSELSNLLDHHVVWKAFHDSQHLKDVSRCQEGTRMETHNCIEKWANARDSTSILSLNGPEGSGKSALAVTWADRFADAESLVGSFCFSSDEGNYTDGLRLVTTIAHQLSANHQSTQIHVEAAMTNDKYLVRRNLRTQMRKLIVEPIRKAIADAKPLFIVLDGLDQCVTSEPGYRPYEVQERVLEAVLYAAKESTSLRFLLTWRTGSHFHRHSQPHRRKGRFFPMDLSLNTHPFQKIDIQRFFEIHSDSFAGNSLRMETVQPWANILQALVHKSQGSFRRARNIVENIQDDNPDATHNLLDLMGELP